MALIPNRWCALTLALCVALSVATLSAQDPALQTPTIVTSGEAVIRRAPDLAFLTVSVESRGRAPREVQAQNAAAMTKVQQQIAAAGIPRDALRTLGYHIQQVFDVQTGKPSGQYSATNTIEIRLENIERAGDVIDAAVQAGATSVGGVRFELRDRPAAEREALRLAVVDARARADAAAAGVGRTVDRVLKIDDRPQSPEQPMQYMAMRAAPAAAGGAPPIDPGTIEIRSSVTLTVSIK